ncbi:hypothetical protein Tco_0551482 [Tanacetum coccineum]
MMDLVFVNVGMGTHEKADAATLVVEKLENLEKRCEGFFMDYCQDASNMRVQSLVHRQYELYGLLCRHILYVLRMNNVNEFPREYVLDRWSKFDDNSWVDTSAFAYTVDRLVPFKDKLDLYRLELSNLLAKAEAEVSVLMRVNKKDTFCSMLGVTEPESVVIKVPRHSTNKGTGYHTRWKNIDELIQNEAESSKKRRTCFVCGRGGGAQL